MSEAATVAIPRDVIEPIVQARIQAAIVESLGAHKMLVENAVAAVLHAKVDSEGRPSAHSYNNYGTFLEHLAKKAISEAAKAALNEYMEQGKEALKARVKKELEKKSSLLAAALVDGLERSVKSTYGFNISVNLKSKDE